MKPMSLADNSGAINLGNAVTQVSTEWMGKILKAQRDTEISNASVAIQNQKAAYDKWLVDNPEMASDEMQNATQFTKMFGDDFKSQLLKSTKNRDAQHTVGLMVNEYSSSFKLHAQKTAGAIVAQRSADMAQNHLEIAIGTNNKPAVDETIKIGLDNGLIRNEDHAEIIKRDAYAKIDNQVKEQNQQAASNYLSSEMTRLAGGSGSWKTSLDTLNNPETHKILQEQYGLSREDINKEFGYLKTQASYKEAQEKKALDNQKESEKTQVDNIFIKPQEEFLNNVEGALSSINNSKVLTTDEKEEERKKITDRVDAIKQDKIDTVNQYDPVTYLSISAKVRDNPEQVKPSEIDNLVGRGLNGGITIAQRNTLRDKLEGNYSDITKTGDLKRAENLIGDLIREKDKFSGMFTDNVVEISVSAESIMELDAKIEAAKLANKPLVGRDLMIEALKIGSQSRERVKELKNKEKMNKENGLTGGETRGDVPKEIKIKPEIKKFTPEIGAYYLKLSNGDRTKAKAMAIEDGYK